MESAIPASCTTIEWPFELIGGKENLIISEKDLHLMSFADYKKL